MNDRLHIENSGDMLLQPGAISQVELIVNDMSGRQRRVALIPSGHGVNIYADGLLIGNIDMGNRNPRIVADCKFRDDQMVLIDFLPTGMQVDIPKNLHVISENQYSIVYGEKK